MKKTILLSLMVLMFGFSQAQRYSFTPATNDSIVGAATKYCTLPASWTNGITARWNGCIEVVITPSISSSDSTHVWVEASQNGSTWYQVKGTFGYPLCNVGTVYQAGHALEYKARLGTSAASFLWSPSWYFNAPYYRVAVQHFKAATSVKITRAQIYLKK